MHSTYCWLCIVDESRTETVDGIARYQPPGRENLGMLRVLVPQTATWRVFSSSACLLFPFVPSITLYFL